MKKNLLFSLFVMTAMAAVAQNKAERASDQAVETAPTTLYYGQKVPLSELIEGATVATVELPDDNGKLTLYSFDTLEEAQEAITIKLGARSTFQCTCYKDTNFQGSSITFIGRDHNTLRANSFNDVISSYQCNGGSMTLYKDKNFTGASMTTTQLQDSNLHDDGFGDNISSIYFSF